MVAFVRLVCLLTLVVCAGRATYAADTVFHEQGVDHRDIPKLRLWLWEHWSHHRSGKATLKWITVEGDAGTSDYTIAKARDGAWYLSIHLQGTERGMPPGAPQKWRDEWMIAFSVARVEEPYHDDWAGKPIQHSRPIPARKFVLELKDKEGKILCHI